MAPYKKQLTARFFSRGYSLLAVALKKHTHMHAPENSHRSSSQQHLEYKREREREAAKLSSAGQWGAHWKYLYNGIPNEKFQFIPKI